MFSKFMLVDTDKLIKCKNCAFISFSYKIMTDSMLDIKEWTDKSFDFEQICIE